MFLKIISHILNIFTCLDNVNSALLMVRVILENFNIIRFASQIHVNVSVSSSKVIANISSFYIQKGLNI